MVRPRRQARLLLVLLACGGCNAILGNEEGTFKGAPAGGADDGTSGTNAAGAPSTGGSDSTAGTAGSAGSTAASSTGGSAGNAGSGAQPGEGGAGGLPDPGGAGGRSDACELGDGRCQNGLPEQCQAGRWATLDACDVAPDLYCYGGLCLPCSPGTFRCAGSTPEECSELGDWEPKAACGANEPICNPQSGTCTSMRLTGAFTSPGQGFGPGIVLQGEFRLLPASCDNGANVCVRGGFVP